MSFVGIVNKCKQCKYCSCYCNGQSYKSRYKAKKQAIEGWNGIEDIEHERINQ